MRIGITFDLKSDIPLPAHLPDDYQEEFDSPATVEAIASVLRGLGHEVAFLGNGRAMLERVLASPPDFVFNFAEGQGVGRSREARVPAVLEMLGIPYTGSDPLTLAATLDKDCAKRLLTGAKHFRTPYGVLIESDQGPLDALGEGFPFPAIAKPAWEGSSKGIRGKCLVQCLDDLLPVVESLRQDHRQPVLLEEYIDGEELTVGVVGNDPPQVVGVMRVVPLQPAAQFIYSLEVKRDWERRVRYECPARLPGYGDNAFVEKAALEAYRMLGCRDVARIDFRLSKRGLYFLEANPLPGLNPDTGDLIIMARLSGWSYEHLIGGIFQAALDRQAGALSPIVACPPKGALHLQPGNLVGGPFNGQ